MKERISAFMDGESGGQEFERTLAAVREPGEALETWRMYHLISDAMRDTGLNSSGFAERVAARIAEEPTVLAPSKTMLAPSALPQQAAQPAEGGRGRWYALSAAASVAAVALVGWVTLAPQPGEQALVAQTQAQKPPAVVVAEPVNLPLTTAADDYLLAHQAYSPRNSFQGVAPYVRTVATRPAERAR